MPLGRPARRWFGRLALQVGDRARVAALGVARAGQKLAAPSLADQELLAALGAVHLRLLGLHAQLLGKGAVGDHVGDRQHDHAGTIEQFNGCLAVFLLGNSIAQAAAQSVKYGCLE